MQKEIQSWHGSKAQFPSRAREFSRSFQSVQILARKEIGDNKVELKFQLTKLHRHRGKTTPSLDTVTKFVTLLRVGRAWQITADDSGSYETNWDEGSQAEPQP